MKPIFAYLFELLEQCSWEYTRVSRIVGGLDRNWFERAMLYASFYWLIYHTALFSNCWEFTAVETHKKKHSKHSASKLENIPFSVVWEVEFCLFICLFMFLLTLIHLLAGQFRLVCLPVLVKQNFFLCSAHRTMFLTTLIFHFLKEYFTDEKVK